MTAGGTIVVISRMSGLGTKSLETALVGGRDPENVDESICSCLILTAGTEAKEEDKSLPPVLTPAAGTDLGFVCLAGVSPDGSRAFFSPESVT